MTVGASLLHIPLKSKQGTLYTRDSRGNRGERKKGRGAGKKKTEEEKRVGSKRGSRANRRVLDQEEIR